jgi:predicted GH43/DUF377 family glycosyl hydrolase
MQVERTRITIKPNPKRVLFRPIHIDEQDRIYKIIARVMMLSESQVHQELKKIKKEFEGRHPHYLEDLENRYKHFKNYVFTDTLISQERKWLIAAHFSQEYTPEAAALFNPSMIWHPDQNGVPEQSRRFILSLRATGESHISSITFRTGIIDAQGQIKLDTPSSFVTNPDPIPNSSYEKSLFEKKLYELGVHNDYTQKLMQKLPEYFTYEQLERVLETEAKQRSLYSDMDRETFINSILSLAQSNYEIDFHSHEDLSERAIFPSTEAEIKGLEDARFVEFIDSDLSRTFYATYTAYDGNIILPQLLETKDFKHFKINTLNGPAVQYKGFALFPRKIDGRYAILSNQDKENIYLMFSDYVHFWHDKTLLARPRGSWESLQIGNCGSPIETSEGWLVLTYGMGPMRRVAMGAMLLDRDDPLKIIGRLDEPLLKPTHTEREGYVPNVLFSCGAQVHHDYLIIPYSIADSACSFARIKLSALIDKLLKREKKPQKTQIHPKKQTRTP